MKKLSLLVLSAAFLIGSPLARATQADDTTITITAQTPGATPFLSQLTLSASDTTVIKSIQFTIAPRPNSVTRALSGTYAHDYLVSRGYLQPPATDIFLPIYGLYDGYTNTVTLAYHFLDGSSRNVTTTITTPVFDDQGCGYKNATALQARKPVTSLSYDYIFVRSGCGDYSPIILDTDRFLRWVSTFATPNSLFAASTFYQGSAYVTLGARVSRVDLDGTVTQIGDYSSIGVHNLHHNIDPGKTGIIIEADTDDYFESTFFEIKPTDGTVIKSWSMGDIISATMTAGGDDPSQFVYPTPTDWFHNNAVTYNRLDDSLIVSSRENFVICIDYKTSAIKWILGDPTKKWHQFPSLARLALDLGPNTLPPIGQHGTSLTFDRALLLFDDGLNSLFQTPAGALRTYAAPRKYQLDITNNVATEVWNFEMGQSILDPICSSVYEDAPFNYLIDYAFVGGFGAPQNYAQLLGLDAAGNTIFYYQYPTVFCNTAYNSLPIHLENTKFPIVGPQALNLSARGTVAGGDNDLIVGFIVTGTEDKVLALRALGASLTTAGVTGALADPVLTIYDSTGAIVATNDNWQSDPAASQLTAEGLAPTDANEAATIQTLAPGAYTAIASSKDGSSGVSLLEAYDLSPDQTSQLANVSARGSVATADNVLIAGFIVGDVENASLIVRGLGPSLAPAVGTPLSDPTITIFDSNGTALATNDNWQDDVAMDDVQSNGLAPGSASESALVLHPPAGSYSAILSGAGGGTGVGLIEVYDLD